MGVHNKRLQYTVCVAEPNAALGSLLLEQFGGPDGELAAAMRYFTQGLAEEDPGRKDLLLDLDTSDRRVPAVLGARTRSRPHVDPLTGAELGSDPAPDAGAARSSE